MEAPKDSSFGIIDYCFFAAMLVISLAIGGVATLKGNKSPEEFLLGNRSFNPIPVALSLLTSFISAISLLGFSGETYAYGMQISLFLVGVVSGILGATFIILPVIHPLKLVSINEYLELRYKSSKLVKVVTVITSIKGVIYMGVALYAPTLALATVTPLTSETYIIIIGCVVTLYSSTGGVRAVVWTDVFQLTVMFIGLVTIVVVGGYDVGGPTRAWNVAVEGGRMDIFNLNPSFYERHTLWNTIIFGFTMCFSFFGVSQTNTQRLCSVPTMKEAQMVLIMNIFGMIVLYALIFISGIIVYSAYFGCDPLELGIVSRKEEVLPHYMVDRLGFITGLPGVFVATVVGGALSSLSSAMNAVVALVWKDFLSQLNLLHNVKPKIAGLIDTAISFVVGGIAIGVAFLSIQATNLVQFSNTITSAALGPILGIFLLGMLTPKTNTKGAWAGLLISLAINIWISVGSFLYKISTPHLPLSAENCPTLALNFSLAGNTTQFPVVDYSLVTDSSTHESVWEFPFMALYQISYTLYGFIGCVICIFSGSIVSILTGNQDIAQVSPEYITPCMRKFYWSKDVLKRLKDEDELASLRETNTKSKKSIELASVENGVS